MNTALERLSVLLVEDEPEARVELGKFLRRRVGRLTTAENGKLGLEEGLATEPDVIVTDLKMPEMDGLDMIRQLRKGGYTRPVIILSALSDSVTILQAVDLGIVKYLVKPVDPSDVETALVAYSEQLLRNRNHIILRGKVATSEAREQAEREIGRLLSAHWKEHTRKGPKRVQVQLQSDTVRLRVEEALTPAERFLLKNRSDYQLVKQFRALLSERLAVALLPELQNMLGGSLTLETVQVDKRMSWVELIVKWSNAGGAIEAGCRKNMVI